MLPKKSQISAFIIIGLIILATFSFAFWIYDKINKPEETDPITQQEVAAVKTDITACVSFIASYGLFKLGVRGGYTELTENYFSDISLKVAYAYNNGKTLVSIKVMENQLSAYMNDNIKDCISYYKIEESHHIKLEFGIPSTETTIARKDVRFEVNLPVTLRRGNSTVNIEDFGTKIPIRLKYIHSLVDRFVQNKINTNNILCLDCTDDPNIKVTIRPYQNSTLFIIEDGESVQHHGPDKYNPYKFFFVMAD